MQRMPLVAWLGWGVAALTLPAAEHRVSSATNVARASDKLKPGDTLVMADGTGTNQAIVFRGRGTAKEPVTLRAETPGNVFLVGESSVTIEGEYLVVSGLFLN